MKISVYFKADIIEKGGFSKKDFGHIFSTYLTNPFTIPLASGSVTLSSDFVVRNYPDLWKEFKDWANQKKLLNQ